MASASSSSSDGSMRVLEQCRVSPSPATLTQQPSSLPLTFFDIVWLHTSPVERLFLYPFPHSTAVFTDSYLPNLKSSLSLALHHFYPLAGKLRRSPDPRPADLYELHYAEGDSVSLTVAESDLDFLDLVGYHARDSSNLSSLVPRLPPQIDDNKPLLAVQVTLFPNHGVGIGVTVHHVACDGLNSTHFIKSWASSCKSGGHVPLAGPAPSFDRSVIADPCDIYSEFLRDMNSFIADKPSPPISRSGSLVHATFTLGPDRIEGLKTLVQSRSKSKSKSFHCSTFVVSCAYLWTCIVKERGYRSDATAHFGFVVDWRKRLQPPAPDTYFGNCLGPCFVEAMAGDLVREDGFIAAAEAIGRAIEGLKGGDTKCLSGSMSRYLSVSVSECPPLGVAGSPRFKVYDADFGWGRPLKVEVPSIKDTGAMSLSESRDVQGGLEIGLALPKHEMEALAALFEEGLQLF